MGALTARVRAGRISLHVMANSPHIAMIQLFFKKWLPLMSCRFTIDILESWLSQ